LFHFVHFAFVSVSWNSCIHNIITYFIQKYLSDKASFRADEAALAGVSISFIYWLGLNLAVYMPQGKNTESFLFMAFHKNGYRLVIFIKYCICLSQKIKRGVVVSPIWKVMIL
jgi:hypothetical protein